jgi:hypothetical protein
MAHATDLIAAFIRMDNLKAFLFSPTTPSCTPLVRGGLRSDQLIRLCWWNAVGTAAQLEEPGKTIPSLGHR